MVGIFFIPNLRLRLIALFVTISQIVLIGYRVDWYSGGSFGARYFIELLPFFALGITALLNRLPHSAGWSGALYLGGAALVLHQFVLMFAVEHLTEGWFDVAAYFQGQPLGIAWQLDAVLSLLNNPSLWFAPRPYVAVDRQTLLVNVLSGVRDPNAYHITGTALVLTMLITPFAAWLHRFLGRQTPGLLLTIIVVYFATWAIFILSV